MILIFMYTNHRVNKEKYSLHSFIQELMDLFLDVIHI